MCWFTQASAGTAGLEQLCSTRYWWLFCSLLLQENEGCGGDMEKKGRVTSLSHRQNSCRLNAPSWPTYCVRNVLVVSFSVEGWFKFWFLFLDTNCEQALATGQLFSPLQRCHTAAWGMVQQKSCFQHAPEACWDSPVCRNRLRVGYTCCTFMGKAFRMVWFWLYQMGVRPKSHLLHMLVEEFLASGMIVMRLVNFFLAHSSSLFTSSKLRRIVASIPEIAELPMHCCVIFLIDIAVMKVPPHQCYILWFRYFSLLFGGGGACPPPPPGLVISDWCPPWHYFCCSPLYPETFTRSASCFIPHLGTSIHLANKATTYLSFSPSWTYCTHQWQYSSHVNYCTISVIQLHHTSVIIPCLPIFYASASCFLNYYISILDD